MTMFNFYYSQRTPKLLTQKIYRLVYESDRE